MLSVPEGVKTPATSQPARQAIQGSAIATAFANPGPRAATSCGRNSSTVATVTRFTRPSGSITFQARFMS